MAQTYYSFKLKRAVPLLAEPEWVALKELLLARLQNIQDYRREHGASLAAAKAHDRIGAQALTFYARLTGVELPSPDDLWSVRKSDYGALCSACARPMRTPKAKLCAECGHMLPPGMMAGPLA